MRHLLQLHPHKHTGKVLHHKHTSYHALFLVLGLAGVFMVFLSSAANAADYIVTATVPAPIPSGAPVITSPVNGLVTSTTPIIISGTCPVVDPAVIITLNDGSDMLGSNQCTTDGTFSVTIPLREHTYSIVATVVTTTGDTGQSSQPITLTYKAPVTTTKPTTHKPAPATTADLEIISDKPYVVFGPNADAVWSGYFKGGTTPYRITINWGDGTTHIYKNIGQDQQTYAHHYPRLKAFQITVTVDDSAGHSASKSFAAATPLVFDNGPNGAGITKTFGEEGVSPTMLLYALYFALLALFFTMWRQNHHRMHMVPVISPKRAPQRQKRRK